MKNRTFLPENFLVKHEGNNADSWNEFITFLNENHIVPTKVKGDAVGHFYGLLDDLPIIINYHDKAFELLTLEEVETILLGGEIETVETYEGKVINKAYAVSLSRKSKFSGLFARKSETTKVGRSIVLISECVTVVSTGESKLLQDVEADENYIFSSRNNGWIDKRDSNTHFGFINSDEEAWFSNKNVCVSTCDGKTFYDESTAEDCDYKYARSLGDWVHEDNWDEWDSERLQEQNGGYHNMSRGDKRSSTEGFSVGFEVEKEDEMACRIHYQKVHDATEWCKERDGSLSDDAGGFELVSPIFNLYGCKALEQDLENKYIAELVNADHSGNCGGHINIGHSEYSTNQIFEGLSGFFPLLYAMFEGRLGKEYSKAKEKHKYYSRDKYSAIFIKDNVVEIRIPSAVRNVDNLIWRRDLMRIMCDNFNRGESEVLRMLLNPKSKLHRHLRKIYSVDKLLAKADKFVQFSAMYSNIALPKITEKAKEHIKKNDKGVNTTDLAA